MYVYRYLCSYGLLTLLIYVPGIGCEPVPRTSPDYRPVTYIQCSNYEIDGIYVRQSLRRALYNLQLYAKYGHANYVFKSATLCNAVCPVFTILDSYLFMYDVSRSHYCTQLFDGSPRASERKRARHTRTHTHTFDMLTIKKKLSK